MAADAPYLTTPPRPPSRPADLDLAREVVGPDVYARYSRWCARNGYKPLSSEPFGRRLKSVGIRTSESRAGGRYMRYYVGISVMLAAED